MPDFRTIILKIQKMCCFVIFAWKRIQTEQPHTGETQIRPVRELIEKE